MDQRLPNYESARNWHTEAEPVQGLSGTEIRDNVLTLQLKPF